MMTILQFLFICFLFFLQEHVIMGVFTSAQKERETMGLNYKCIQIQTDLQWV